MKSSKTLKILSRSDRPWMVRLQFAYSPVLKDAVKAFPGAAWVPALKAWEVPIDVLQFIIPMFERAGYNVEDQR